MIIKAGAIAFIAVCIVVIVLLFLPSLDVNYSIRMHQSEIPRGTNVTLFYEVENGLLFQDIDNVWFNYSIKSKSGQTQKTGSKYLDTIKSWNTVSGYVWLEISKLWPGEYVIHTTINYYPDDVLKTKYLTLELTIY